MENQDLFSLNGASNLAARVKNIDGQIRVRRGTTSSNDAVSHHEGTKKAEVNIPNISFASIIAQNQGKSSVKIKKLHNNESVAGANVTIPMEAIEEVSSRFRNTLYGYFIGKRLAFPLVENYVKNTWAKFGLKRVMLDGSFFLFQFDSKNGMDRVIEAGPWLIRKLPLILNVWSPNTILKKDNIRSVPVWVKLYNVPIVAYSEVGLSLITTQIGNPIMLDEYTSTLCVKSWGRKEYARALVELSSEADLMDSIVIAIPHVGNTDHSLVTVNVEYEWKPPRCSTCKIFDHQTEACPRNIKVEVKPNGDNEGYIQVRKGNKTHQVRQVEGVRLSKPKPNLHYRRIEKGTASAKAPNQVAKVVDQSTSNQFSVLAEVTEDVGNLDMGKGHVSNYALNESDSDEEELLLEDQDGIKVEDADGGMEAADAVNSGDKGASTPLVNVSEKGMNSSSGQPNQGVDKSNKFSVLANTGVELCDLDSVKDLLNVLNESDSDEDELIMEDEDGVNIGASDLKGASTPSIEVDHD